jgi:hypothetical protein
MENDRLQRWLSASNRLSHLETWLGFVTSSLGRLDCTIIARDSQVVVRRRPLDGGGYIYDTSESLSLSYFWVLGTYELVRVIDQRARAGDPFCAANFAGINKLKRNFERIRIPLAKLEASRKNETTDFRTAIPIFDFKLNSTAWVVAPKVVVRRRELANSLLYFFTAFKKD